MKLVTFALSDDPETGRLGALTVDGDRVVDLQATHAQWRGDESAQLRSMLELLDGGATAMAAAREVLEYAQSQQPAGCLHALSQVRLLAPLPVPRSLRDCLTFEEHLHGCTQTAIQWRSPPAARLDRIMRRYLKRPLVKIPQVWYEQPIYYKGNPHSVVGPEAEIRWPRFTTRLDYELEFAVVIGRHGRDIPVDEAPNYIAGFTIFNDFSARDTQMREMQGRLGPAKSKDFDTGNVLGPWLVTPEELPDVYDLTMTARVNGQEWSRGTTADMRFRFEEIIRYISQDETLLPGDVIGSGTVGTGCGMELDRWLSPGDVVELEVTGLGVLRNRVVRNNGSST